MKPKLITILILLPIIALCLYAFIPNNSETKNILIAKGTSKSEIAQILAKEQIISAPPLYWLLEQIMTINHVLQAGEYAIPAGVSPYSIIAMMRRGDVVIHKITIPEGFTTHQVLAAINNDQGLLGQVRTQYLEGSFLPSTYFYTLGDSKQQMLDKIQQSLRDAVIQLWPTRTNQTLTQQQMLVLASIVEKETRFDDERPLVAAVFYNRLKKGMRLQADPTTIYAITMGKYILERPLSKKDLQIPSPFNTYTSSGLPPTPIANPGIESIKAVLNPAVVDYLYFVANSEGKHSFSASLAEHNRNVQSYRLRSQ